jgi:hypothetical protein
MTATLNGLEARRVKLSMPLVGVWHADVESGGEPLADGAPASLELYGETFVGSSVRSSSLGGVTRTKLVGGAGRLSTELPAAHYVGATARTVLLAALGEAGETLSADSDPVALATRLDSWGRSAGPASRAIQRLCDWVGSTWRVLPDGTVWVGIPTWDEYSDEHRLLDEDWGAGSALIAPDAPTLRPGQTLGGVRMQYVVHTVEDRALRTEGWLNAPGGALDRFLAAVRTEIDYSRIYPGTVKAQHSDGSLAVKLDDSRVSGPGGLDKVPLRTGVPGFKATVAAGSRVRVGFDSGDPSLPFAALWDDGANVTRVSFDGGTRSFARVGDFVRVYPNEQMIALGIVLPIDGIIMSGNTKAVG